MAIEWIDESRYSQTNKERIPKIWKCYFGKISVCVHRHIHYTKDQWLLSSEPFFDKYELPQNNIEDAKKAAIKMVKKKLQEVISNF